jgi:hypothetical protein
MGPLGAFAGGGAQIYGAIAGYPSATAEQKMQDSETKRLRQEAESVRNVTSFKQERQAEEGARDISSMEAAAGAGGAVSTQGAPLMAGAKQSAENKLSNLMIGYEGIEKEKGLLYEADLSRWKARVMGQNKRMELYGKLAGAGGLLLGGFSQMSGSGVTGQAVGGADPSYVASPEFESLSGQYGVFM